MHAAILREHAEPREGREGMSLWMIGFFMLLVFWAGWYVAMHAGDWRGDVLDASPESGLAGGGSPGQNANVNPLQLGRQLFSNCMPCHQVDGRGLRGLYPPLAGSDWVQGDPEVLSQIVLRGVEGPIDIKGDRYNSIMPPWSQRFDDQELAALLTYIRSNFGNQSSAVSPKTVAMARDKSAGRVRSWRVEELTAMTNDNARRAAESAKENASTQSVEPDPVPSSQEAHP